MHLLADSDSELLSHLPHVCLLSVDLVLRHAGTLGLCSLIRAFPYTVPSWMPDLLMVLDRHMADPSPIQVSSLCLLISQVLVALPRE